MVAARPRPRALISTIATDQGGVPRMVDFVTGWLLKNCIEPVISYYEPYSRDPSLSMPLHRSLAKCATNRSFRNERGFETHAIGAWLPELEITHNWISNFRKSLIDSCDFHLAVSGNSLPALAYAQRPIPFVLWVASGWQADRRNRVARLKFPRRLFDHLVIQNIVRASERRILRRGTVLALSKYTQAELHRLAPEARTAVVFPMPIVTERFSPGSKLKDPYRVGFVGRLNDPRKNVNLLLKTAALLRPRFPAMQLELIGGTLHTGSERLIDVLGIRSIVKVRDYLPDRELIERLRVFDVFAIPSAQEGLCIAALEAMACGCPVVSTRCGGPEEFVIDDETGYLADHTPESLGNAIARILCDPHLRTRLSKRARNIVQDRYSEPVVSAIWERTFSCVYPDFTTGRSQDHSFDQARGLLAVTEP